MATSTNIRFPTSPFLEPTTGRPSREWIQWLQYPNFVAVSFANPLPIASGGTGLSTLPGVGELLIGTGSEYQLNTLTPGTGISVTNTPGDISIANTGVLSFSASTTGLTPSTATNGNVVLGGTLIATHGGTGLNTYAVGDLLYASSATALARLADVATGNALISGGVGVAPAWGKIGLTTHVTGVLGETNGGTGNSTYATGDILYASAANTLSKLAKPSANSLLTMSSAGAPSWKNPKYGAFLDTTAQTAAANTPTEITLDTTTYSNGITIGSPTSQVVVDTAGLYNIQFSIQFANTGANEDDVYVWLRVNGNDVADSNSFGTVAKKHGSINGHLIMALNLFYQFSANDYFELVWMTVGGTTSLEVIPASGTPPVYPRSPSIILTVSNNIAA